MTESLEGGSFVPGYDAMEGGVTHLLTPALGYWLFKSLPEQGDQAIYSILVTTLCAVKCPAATGN